MSSFTAVNARAISRKQTMSDDQVFARVRKMCDQCIQDQARNQPHVKETFFMVPSYIFGLPLFDPEPIMERLYYSLTKRGFQVYATEKPLELYISWEPPKKVPKPQKPSAIPEPQETRTYRTTKSTLEKLAELKRNMRS
jgi:hypothetical protein